MYHCFIVPTEVAEMGCYRCLSPGFGPMICPSCSQFGGLAIRSYEWGYGIVRWTKLNYMCPPFQIYDGRFIVGFALFGDFKVTTAITSFIAEVVSLYGYYLRPTPYFISTPGLYLMSRPPSHGVKVGLQPKPKWPPPLFWGRGVQICLIFFDFVGKKFQIFACGDLEIFFGVTGSRNDEKKIFGGDTPVKRGGESIFEGFFFFNFDKKFSLTKEDWEKCLILPRPY